MGARFGIVAGAVALVGAWIAGCSSPPACIAGSTLACLCVGGASGVQSCQADGTYAPCQCGPGGSDSGTPGLDGGQLGPDASEPPPDGATSSCPSGLTECGGRCVDTSTDEAHCGGCGDVAANRCASGSFCVGGACQDVGACPPPFVVCDGACVDPGTDPAYCGASAACTGATAGLECGGVCYAGRCVYESCSDVLRHRHSTGDGLYLVDLDGTGPLAPSDVYCDMTTAGGGWMLVYKIRNDVPDIADPWWGMVGIGVGETMPTSPAPIASGAHFQGPVRSVRAASYSRASARGPVENRATLLSASGTVVLDIRGPLRGLTSHTLAGYTGTPYRSSSYSFDSTVMTAAAGIGLTAGEVVHEDPLLMGGQDVDYLRTMSGSAAVPLCGDDSVNGYGSLFVGSTTLFWVRENMP